jgi:P-type Cu+ transporter
MSENSPSGMLIENAALSLEGVLSASYNADCQTGIFSFSVESCSARKIVDTVESLGYSVEPILKAAKQIYFQQLVCQRNKSMSCSSTNKFQEIKRWRNTFCICLIFGVPTMAIMMYYMWSMDHWLDELLTPGLSTENLLLFLFSTPVQVNHVKKLI